MAKQNRIPRTVVMLICLLGALAVAPRLRELSAQDTTPSETPTETATETATLTATLTETPTPVPTDTATLTETATETATEAATVSETIVATETPTLEGVETASPTATLIETPTETATSDLFTPSPSPTLTASATQPALPTEPPLTELFTDNFDTGALYLWTLGAGWALVPSEGGQALQVTNSDEPVTFVHNTLTDMAVQASFQFDTGMARLSVRQSEAGAYSVLLDSTGQVALLRGGEMQGTAAVSPNTPNVWRTVRLSAIGDVIRVTIDGVTVIVVQDTTPLLQGTISFASIAASSLLVDNLAISVSSTELTFLPTPTATSEGLLPPTNTPVPYDDNAASAFSGQSPSLMDAGNVFFLNVASATELKDAIIYANAHLSDTYVIRLASGTYSFDTVWSPNFPAAYLVIEGTVILVGLESYNLGIPPFVSNLPDTRKAIIQRSDNATQMSVINVRFGGNLTLYNVVVRNGGGSVPGTTPPVIFSGGGIVNSENLNIYNSLIADNTADVNAGGIMNNSNAHLTVVNTVFRNNKTLNKTFLQAGGGAIANGGGIISNVSCVTFESNDSRDGGAIFNSLFGDGGTISLQNVNFLNNTAIRAKAAFGGGNSGQITLSGNVHWEPTSDLNTTQFGGVNITPSPGSITNGSLTTLNCTVPAPPMPVRVNPGNVSPESQAFQNQWQLYGLPPPLDRLPYNIVQKGQLFSTSSPTQSISDPLGVTTPVPPGTPTPFPPVQPYGSQAYGPSSYSASLELTAIANPTPATSLYKNSFSTHSGIDYGPHTVFWNQRVIVSMCDGVIIPGNWYQTPGNLPTGGSAQPGTGVSVRCFMDSLSTGSPDRWDGNGKPELSNIVITYNHLLPAVPPSYGTPRYISCLLVDVTGCVNQYELPRAGSGTLATVCPIITSCVGDVVRTGDVLGQTGGDTSIDHLHLAILFARGFARPGYGDNAFYLNPFLLYSSKLSSLHFFQTYFPYLINSPVVVQDPKGIQIGQLNWWSGGGFNFANPGPGGNPYGRYTPNNFWNVQRTTISGVEWSNDYYPLIPSTDPSHIEELMEYLNEKFTLSPFQPVNCSIAIDINRSPAREVATCDFSDLNNEQYWTPILHPTPTPTP